MTQNDIQQDPAAPQAEQSVQGAVRRSGTYHGRPCKNCGETLKLQRNWMCVACERIRQRDSKRRLREDRITYYRTLLDNRRRSALRRKEQRG